MKSKLINQKAAALGLLLYLFSVFAGHGMDVPEAAPLVVDQRAALDIGSHHVSNYLVDKYYKRFAASVRQEKHRTASAADSKAWFEQFMAKQVVVAYAISLGYLRRPEVTGNVARMERHMLTQAAGPFYEQLYKQLPPVSDTTIKSLYTHMFDEVDGIVARFNDDAAAAASLGGDFDVRTADEQTLRILKCRERDDAEVMDGQMSWPFRPFSEIADVLRTAPSDRWVKNREPSFGTYYIFIRSVKPKPAGNFSSDEEGFRMFVQLIHQETFQRRRRNELLASSAFVLDGSIASRLAEVCQNLEPAENQIPETPVRAFAAEPLFRYRVGQEITMVTVEAYRRHFNELYIRQVPHAMVDLRRTAEDMAVEDLDFRAARAQGIDRTPQFTEDRIGFAGFQALDLFEQEVLVPKLGIGQPEIERYYAEHQSEFFHTSKIRGRLLTFETLEKALTWNRQQKAGPGTLPVEAKTVPSSDQELELASDQTIPDLEAFQEILFRIPEGAVFGPVQRGQFYVCFLKQKNMAMSPVPLSAAAATIRRTLVHQALDARELTLAAELGPRLNVGDHIDYARYGITPNDLAQLSRP
jgi:hypothetical protein